MDMRVTNRPEDVPAQNTSPTRARPRRRRLVLWFVIVGLLLVVFLGAMVGFDLFRQKMIANFFAGNVPPPVPVSAVAATSESISDYLDGIGSIVAVHQVSVAPEVSGRITKILFDSGAEVKAGDPLVQLNDDPERADLANFQALANIASLTLGRSHQLAAQQYAAQQTVDQNKSALQVAQANILRAQAMIDQKLVKAPFNGQLGVRQVDVGQYLNAGTPIVTLTDLDTLHVNFTLPEQARAALAVGQPVEFRVDAFQNRVFKAILTTIEPQIDPLTRNIKIQATLDNPGHLLLPGMFAAARVQLPAQPNILTVPETAVDYSAYGESVYVLRDDGKTADGKPKYKAIQTFVKTGTRRDGKIAILDGVKVGELVVNAGQVKLQNGAEAVVTGAGDLWKPSTTPNN
jgi:membrane fusion protein, multidrug efflux system